MFREMYSERDDYDSDSELSEYEEAMYSLFLIFKSIIDALIIKTGLSGEEQS
jgi:hypothetical protein